MLIVGDGHEEIRGGLRCLAQVLEQNAQFGTQPVAAYGGNRMELEKWQHSALGSFYAQLPKEP